MRTRKLIVLILALVIVLGGAYLLYNKLSGKFAPQQISGGNTVPAENSAENNSGESSHNYMAPDFTVYDAGGMSVKLSDYLGKPVIVNFWASWCGPCKSEMPEFEEAFKQYGSQIQFMMINLTFGSETESSAKSFILDNGYNFPVYFDATGDASGLYGVSAIPTTYFINAKGEIEARAVGALNAETLRKGIDILLAK